MKFLGIIIFLVLCQNTFGQEFKDSIQLKKESLYENDFLTPKFHKARRQEFRNLMQENSVAVFFSSPEQTRSNDVQHEFHQSPDFYYLSGLNESNSVLLLFKPPILIKGKETNEVLIVKENNKQNRIWTGNLTGTKLAVEKLGLQTSVSGDNFDSLGIHWELFKEILLSKHPDAPTNEEYDQSDLADLLSQFNSQTEKSKSKISEKTSNKIMAQLREIKREDELVLMQKAIDITCSSFNELLKAVEPEMYEYQTESIIEYLFKMQGAEFQGYPSICGAAENTTILHYSTNRRKLLDGDLLVVDAGAEYHNYTADVTRTIPVNGKFSASQKAIYEIVLAAQIAGIEACLSGKEFKDPGRAATAVIKKGLLDLGIINSANEYSTYFMHGTSHHLGLDVHDISNYGALKPGMIITVEPGIYIKEGSPCDPKWWNIGIRIEDDVLITDSSPKVLSENTPKKIDEIELLMKEKSIFNQMK